MRRTEAHQGVRMIKFSSILSRYEAAEFSQAEAAELLGIGERTFRRWRQRFEERAKLACLIGGWVRPRASGFLRIGAKRWRRCIARVTRVSRPSIFMSIW